MAYGSPCLLRRRKVSQWRRIDAEPPAPEYFKVGDDDGQQKKQDDVSINLIHSRFSKERQEDASELKNANGQHQVTGH